MILPGAADFQRAMSSGSPLVMAKMLRRSMIAIVSCITCAPLLAGKSGRAQPGWWRPFSIDFELSQRGMPRGGEQIEGAPAMGPSLLAWICMSMMGGRASAPIASDEVKNRRAENRKRLTA